MFVVSLCCWLFFPGSDDTRPWSTDMDGWRVSWLLQLGEVGLFWRLFCAFFFLGVFFGLLLCPRVCLRLLRTRSLSAFCAIPPPTRLLAQALGVALLGFALGFVCLGYGWEGSFCLCRFFAPFCSPCPLRCSAQSLGFGFFWALLLPWCALARCGG